MAWLHSTLGFVEKCAISMRKYADGDASVTLLQDQLFDDCVGSHYSFVTAACRVVALAS